MFELESSVSAFDRLKDNTGLTLIAHRKTEVMGTGLWADMMVLLEHSNIEWTAQVVLNCEEKNIASIISSLQRVSAGQNPLLISEHINQTAAAKLKAAEINYLDIAGNAYLNTPPYFVLIEGRPAPDTLVTTKLNPIFSPTELKVIYALLAYADLLNASYGDVAKISRVALGVVGTIMRDLRDFGFVEESGTPKRKHWLQRQKLISHWVVQYPQLSQQQYLGAYYAAEQNWWRSPELEQSNAVLGGGFAAVCYSENAKPSHASLYIDSEQQWDFLRKVNLVRILGTEEKLKPNLQVYAKFWKEENHSRGKPKVTHPLITYADLICTNCTQNHLVANEIAERYFKVNQ